MKKCSLIIILTTIFLSCSNLSLETESVTVSAIDNGAVLKEGDSFFINIRNNSESIDVNPTTANVSIVYESDNRDLDSTQVEPIELEIDIKENPKPELAIGDNFQEGIYTIYITVLDGESILSEYESKFIVFNGFLSGELESLSPMENLYTNSLVMMAAKIKASDDIDPYLVWKYNDSIITEGYLSQGYDSVIWDTGDLSGFVDIELHLFPFKVEDNLMESENVVSYTFIVNPLSKTLFNKEVLSTFSKAIYFNGNYIDEVNKSLELVNYSDIYPVVRNGFYGMAMGPERGFSSGKSIFTKTENNLDSFSVLLTIKPENLDDGSIFEFGNKSIFNSLSILNEELVNSYSSKGTIESYTIKKLDTLSPYKIVITFIWKGNGFQVLYYVNGEPYGKSFWNLEDVVGDDSILSEDDYILIGGSDEVTGASYVIDTLEVINKDLSGSNNIYQDILADSIENKNQYILADGFNSIRLPKNFSGSGFIDGEYINMLKNDSLDYSELLDKDSDFSLSINTIYNSEYNLILYIDNDPINLDCFGSNTIEVESGKLLLNGEELLEFESYVTGFRIVAKENLLLDSVTMHMEDTVLE